LASLPGSSSPGARIGRDEVTGSAVVRYHDWMRTKTIILTLEAKDD
jgi:hypothetical protein